MPTAAGVGQVYLLPYGSGILPYGGTWVVVSWGINIAGGYSEGSVQFLAGGSAIGFAGTGFVLAQCLYA